MCQHRLSSKRCRGKWSARRFRPTRELLAAAIRDSGEPSLDPAEAREVLRTCLLRLRVERLDEARRDATLLLDDAQREGDAGRHKEIEQEINRLSREREELTKAMHTPTTASV